MLMNIENEMEKLHTDWSNNDGILQRTFTFKGFLKTMSLVNAIAWEANRHMHHPDMSVSFNKCIVNITTHDEGNTLTEKDFLLAKSIDGLLI